MDVGINGIGIRKNEPEFKAFVNAALSKMKDEKFYSEVGEDSRLGSRSSAQEMIKSFETDPPATN